MNFIYDSRENERVVTARDSFSCRLLTNRQFDEVMAMTFILENEIKATGAFKEKLGDLSYAWSRSQRFDPSKAETILRDAFKERTGRTMNQMRTSLAEREEQLTQDQRQDAYKYALEVGELVKTGTRMTFNRALAHKAQFMAQKLNITDAGAKRLMVDEFNLVEGADLYEWGKELDEQYFRPQIEADKKEREQGRSQSYSPRDGAGQPRPRGPQMSR